MEEAFLEFLQTFVAESMDFLDEAEPILLGIAEEGTTGAPEEFAEKMNVVFRLFHTIKGNAQAFELNNMASLAHHAENMLSAIRSGGLVLGNHEADLLCRVADLLRSILTTAPNGDGEFAEQVNALVAELEAGSPKPEKATPAVAQFDDGICWVQEPPSEATALKAVVASTEMQTMFVNEACEALDTVERALLAGLTEEDTEARSNHVVEAFRAMHSLKGNCGFMGYAELGDTCHDVENVLEALKTATPAKAFRAQAHLVLEAVDTIRKSVRRETKAPAKASAPTPKSPVQKIARHDVRVDLRKLDSLVDLVGELVVAEAMVTGSPTLKSIDDERFDRAVHQLRRVILELQDVTMSVRMVPVSQAFQKMVRIVHDVCTKTGKKARLEIRGEETEVDRTLVEHISDPLVHAIRNAIDHGIEPPEERIRKGKDETGLVVLEAGSESGEVWIRISDDGQGLNAQKILKKAVERGIVREDAALSEQQIYELIFEPGFSTAEKLTDVSGRGVGMDVVRKNIADLKGRVKLQSRPGQGMTVSFHIPLTLAVLDGMLVSVGPNKYTIPLLAIQESYRPVENQLTMGPDGSEYIRIREELLPVVRLHRLFGLKPESERLTDGICIIVDAQDRKMAFFVDTVLGQQQTVIKALPSQFMRSKTVSGCTILGTGEVSLIVDIAGISTLAQQKFEQFMEDRRA